MNLGVKFIKGYMNRLPAGLKAIMFDLAGVIIELHYHLTANELAKRAGVSPESLKDLLVTSDVLQRFEVAAISEEDFRKEVCHLLGIEMDPNVFDEVWNALLGEISEERLLKLKQIEQKTLILSNTNSIHERAFNEILLENSGHNSLHEVIDKVYFSHELKLRKPYKEVYQKVMEDQNLLPEEILFIDDREDNIQAARNLGIHVFHNKKLNDWLSLF